MPIIKVEESGRERIVFIPEDKSDPSYTEYLVESETEKTRDELRKMAKKESPKHSKEDVAGVLKERLEYRNRKRRGNIRRYF